MYLDQKAARRSKEEWYLARIAMEVRAGAQPKKRWRLSQFLLNFTRSKQDNVPKTPKEKEAYLARSKAHWDALVFSGQPVVPLTEKQIKDKQTLHKRNHNE